MKILYIIDHLRPDGTQQMLVNLSRGLGERGYHQSVLALNDSNDPFVPDLLRKNGVDVQIIGKQKLLGGDGLIWGYRWLESEEFDIVVTMLFFSDVVGRILAWVAGNKIIISTIRARNVHYTFWQRWLVRSTARFVDIFVLNSDHVRSYAEKFEGMPPERAVVIPNGVELLPEPTGNLRIKWCNKLGIPTTATIIGSVGRLTHQKGFDVLIDAFAQVNQADIHLVIVGTGEAEESLRSQARIFNLNDKIHFLGHRSDVLDLLPAIDLYIQPSRFEGMPNATLEAMAAERPIIASRVDGICELLDQGTHGWLVAPGDKVDLSRAIKAFLRDPEEWKRLGLNAKKRVVENYPVEKMIHSWEKIFVNLNRN